MSRRTTRPPAICEKCECLFSAQEAKAGWTTCEHCEMDSLKGVRVK